MSTLASRVVHEQRILSRRALTSAGLTGIALSLSVLALLAFALGQGRWMAMPRVLPLLGWVSAIAGGAILVRALLRRRRSQLTVAGVATAIEKEQGLRDGSLRGALEVAESGSLGAFAARSIEAMLGTGPLVPHALRELSRQAIHGGTLALGGVLLLSAAGTFLPDGLMAVRHPLRAFDGTLLPELKFDNLPPTVPRGMPVTVHISAVGRKSVTVSRHSQGEAWTDTALSVPQEGRLTFELGPLSSRTELKIADGRSPVATAVLDIEERGWIGNIGLRMHYPAYLVLNDETIEPIPPLRVPRGTRVEVFATLEGGARNVFLVNGRDSVALVPESEGGSPSSGRGIKAVGIIEVDRESEWRWSAEATPRADGTILPPELPDRLMFAVAPDEVPAIGIVSPASDTTIGSTGVLPIIVQATDDHGLGRVQLQIWRERANGQGTVDRENILVSEPGSPVFLGGATIPLDHRSLEPGDRLHVTAFAVDNSPWRQQSQSTELVLRVPSLAEQRAMARSLGDSLAARARQLAQQERNLQLSTADASRNRELRSAADANADKGSGKSNGKMSFNAAERTRQLARDQQQLGARIDSLRQSARDLESRLKSANGLDSALSRQMRDIQKLLRDAMTPEMQRQLEELNRSADRLSGSDAQQAMQQLGEQQRQMREQLERSAEMLKRAALEGSMQTLKDDAADLAEAQKQLATRMDQQVGRAQSQSGANKDRTQGDSSLARDSRTVADRTRDVSREIENLAKRLQEAGARDGASRTRDAKPLADKSSEKMQEAARRLSKQLEEQSQRQGKSGAEPGHPGEQNAGRQGKSGETPGGAQGTAGEEARRAAESMEQAAQRLSDARDSQVNAWKEQLSDQLDRSISETMQMARQQAQLEQQLRQSGGQNAQSLQGAQSALQQGVQRTAERLEQTGRSSSLLSQRSQKAMGEAQRRVQQATQAMQQVGQPNGSEQAQSAMKDASEALNQALSSLVRDRERVNSAQSASGFSEMVEQLKQLAQQQGRLNGQMQGLNLLQGGARGEQAQQQARILSRQQREVARDLMDVADNDQTGRMDALAKEAQAVAQQLERSGLDASVAARQQQLYRRLLDAGRFLEQDERDDEGPREARAGSGRGSSDLLNGTVSGKAASKFTPPSWNDLRGLEPDERRIVIEYFKRLNGNGPPP